MNKKIKLIIGLVALILIIYFVTLQKLDDKPSWLHNVEWSNKPNDASKIEELLWTEIYPYKTEYETVNISATKEDKATRLKVVAMSKEIDTPDIYEFVYEDDKLIMTGYLLEAIPQFYRSEAIAIALREQQAVTKTTDVPTVRRILPETSKKFYMPKTLISVSWKDVSALIDPDEQKIVQTWTHQKNN